MICCENVMDINTSLKLNNERDLLSLSLSFTHTHQTSATNAHTSSHKNSFLSQTLKE